MAYKQNIPMRIVIKIGTSSLTHSNGRLNYRHMEEMVNVICDIKHMGNNVVIVTSGAVGAGFGKAMLRNRPSDVSQKCALAALGQSGLMAIYERLFGAYSCQVAQVLLTKAEMDNCQNNILKSFLELFKFDVLPIVNENDAVSPNDRNFSNSFENNDMLAAYIAKLLKADLLIVWTDVNGLYNKNPRLYADAERIPIINKVTEEIIKMAGGAGTASGTGGMIAKLNAAQVVLDAGLEMVIADSKKPEDVYGILDGDNLGTRFTAFDKAI